MLSYLTAAVIIFFLSLGCQTNHLPVSRVLKPHYVYTIVEHNDSIYYTTPAGEIYRIAPGFPDSITFVGSKQHHPMRSLVFKKDGSLYASSYKSGCYRVTHDSLIQLPRLSRLAWSMKTDSCDNLWMATLQGVFRQRGDSLLRFTQLQEAYDIAFYRGTIAIAHRGGITLYDPITATPSITFCPDTLFWSLTSYDTLLIGGGVNVCALITGTTCKPVSLGSGHNIPWSSAIAANGTIVLATEKGLYIVNQEENRAHCIGFRGKCIKAVLIDRRGWLWIGRFFK